MFDVGSLIFAGRHGADHEISVVFAIPAARGPKTVVTTLCDS
jgi:hypothetical protein